jgi:hypothetical protein
LGCTISLKAVVLPGLKSGRALVKKKKKSFNFIFRNRKKSQVARSGE